jgi:hypothetical protein
VALTDRSIHDDQQGCMWVGPMWVQGGWVHQVWVRKNYVVGRNAPQIAIFVIVLHLLSSCNLTGRPT